MSNTTAIIRLKPRWWQLLLRYRRWREDRELIGQTIIMDGREMTIVKATSIWPDEYAKSKTYECDVCERCGAIAKLAEPGEGKPAL